MRFLDRLGLALLGLAVAVPASVRADDPGTSSTATKTPSASARPPKHHVGLFRRCMCVDCQRARVKATDGVEVPQPPPIPNSIVTRGGYPERMAGAGQLQPALSMTQEDCKVCAEGVPVNSGPVTMVNANEAPGRAVVGEAAPGYAVIGGMVPMAEPAPIGAVQGSYLKKNRTTVANRRGQTDPSVAPAQYSSPNPLPGTGHNRPHIIEHLFGLDAIGKIASGANKERRERENHASIPYGPPKTDQVTELPSSLVYKGTPH